MFDLILVPLDGSALAEAALTVAEQIPSRRVRLLAVESDLAELSAFCPDERDCEAYLQRASERFRRLGRDVETVVAWGGPAEQIVASAATAELIVMGSHGRGGVGRAVLGSVAEWVARNAPVPTMIVRGGERPATAMPLTRIVVPLDGTDIAEQALPVAIALADDVGLPIHLLRVVAFDPVRATVEAGVAAAKAQASAETETVRLAEDYLAQHVQALRNRDVFATSEVRTGDPVSELLTVIREGDIVVLTTRDRGAVERWFLGSVARELVRHAPAPVVLVRATSRTPARRRRSGAARERSSAETLAERARDTE